MDWKETKTRIIVSVSKELNVFADHQHDRGRSKSGTKPSTPASSNSHHHPSLYKEVLTPSTNPKDIEHEALTPLFPSHPAEREHSSCPPQLSSRKTTPLGPRRHTQEKSRSANHPPSSPTCIQKESRATRSISHHHRRSRSRDGPQKRIWRGRGLRSGFGVGSGGPGTPARLVLDPHLHERRTRPRQGRGCAGRGGGVCSAVAGRQAGRLRELGDKRGGLSPGFVLVFGCWIRWPW